MEIELISAFEVTLADARADEAHPAFSNLFVPRPGTPRSRPCCLRARRAWPPSAACTWRTSWPRPTGLLVSCGPDRPRSGGCGRNRGSGAAGALAAGTAGATPDAALDTGLDPVCVLGVRLRIAPRREGAADLCHRGRPTTPPRCMAVIDKYRQASHVQRASLMSATLAASACATCASAPNFAAMQTLTTALVLSLTLHRRAPAARAADVRPAAAVALRHLGRPALLLVSAATHAGLGLLRIAGQALRCGPGAASPATWWW
jgi:cyclic beta-1,2-glucan synthetase